MKLIYCMQCNDVVKLRGKERTCYCGASGGRYLDELKAEFFGPCVPLGFANTSFAIALKNQPEGPGLGERFEAFVIPRVCPTMTKFDHMIKVRKPGAPGDVHTEHCCIVHGCKYGDADCTVENGERRQSGPCEECGLLLAGYYGPETVTEVAKYWPDHPDVKERAKDDGDDNEEGLD